MQPDYDSIVGNMLGMDQARGVKTALSEAYGTNPNIEAELQRVSKTTGVPLSTARNMPNEAKRNAYVNGINAFELAKNYPIFARFITNENNARVAHDDVDNLTALEKAVRELPDEFGSMTGPTPTFGSYLSGLGQSFTSAAEMARQGTRQQFADALGFEGMSDDAQRRFAAAQMQNQMATPEFESSTAQGIYGGASSVMQMIPAVTAGILTRNPYITLGVLGAQTQTQSYPRYRLRGAEPEMALLGATGEGAVEVATEMLPMGFLVNRFGKMGAGDFIKGFLGRELPTEQAATLAQDAIDTAIANPDKTWGEYVAERPEAAYQTALGSLVASGVFGGMNAVAARAVRQEQNAQNAERSAQFLERVTQTAQASALAKRDPDKFEQYVELASETGPVQSVYLDANTLMQSGLAEQLAQVSPSVAEQLTTAAATNGAVQIPISEYAARIAPTEYAQELLDHLKTDPDGFSRNEAREYMQNQAQELQAEVEERIAQQDNASEFRESQQRVKDLVLNELNQIGRFTESKNELDATLIAARTAVRAAQLGTTPEALFERQRLQFAAERIDGQGFDQSGNLQTDTPAFQDWFGDSKVVDDTGAPLVVYHGTAANVEAFDPSRAGEFGESFGPAVFFTQDPGVAAGYAARWSRSDEFMAARKAEDEALNRFRQAVLDHGSQSQVVDEAQAEAERLGAERQAITDRIDNMEIPTEGANIVPAYLSMQDPLIVDAQGQNFRTVTSEAIQRAREEGKDGVIIRNVVDSASAATSRPSDVYVALEPTQIKSATGNRGTFDANDPNILHQSQDEPRDLFVAHNLTAANILAANELGGLAAPSIAIGRTASGFDQFGEVTLLANPALLNDRSIRTFDADVYSPRQPRAHYNLDLKAFNEFLSTLDPDNLGLSKPDDQSASGTDGANALLHSDAVRLKFLQEQGKAPKLKNVKTDPLISKAAKLPGNRYELRDSPELAKIATAYYEKMSKRIAETSQVVAERRNAMWFEPDGSLKPDTIRAFADDVSRFKESGGKDIGQYRNDIRKAFQNKNLERRYEQWVTDTFNQMVEGKRIFKGFTQAGNRRYVPYTMDNVVKEMTRDLRGAEGHFYGAGSVRSAYAQELKTLEQIKARRDQIVSQEAFESIRKEANEVLLDALEKLKPFYKYDADSWNYAEDAGAAIAEGPRGLRQAFNVTPEVEQIVGDLVKYLRNLPTEYFEAKAQRPVQFSEFDTAVVPKGMRKDALQALRDARLKIKTYDPKVEGDRNRVIGQQERLLFQNQRSPRGAFNPDTNTISLLKNADLSTFLHEAGHYFFESDIALAGELVREGRYFGNAALSEGEQQIIDDVSTLLRWHGLTGPIEEQLATWANLGFEEKRAYHERTAESFERYLFEGQAPSIELQPYFQTFRAWLLNVYRSLKDFLTRNPEAGQLNDDVRAIFDRMLATNEQIELAQQARSMMPLFRTEADAENIGMTPDEFAAYQRQDPQAANDAAQDLQARGLRDLQWTRNARNKEIKKLQRQSADLRREARIEVRREVMNQPVYRAWQFLTGKLTQEDQITPAERPRSDPNVLDPTMDSLFVAIAKLGGIRKEDVVREWGIEQSERPESGVFGKPVLRVTDGLSLDDMRQALIENGYLSQEIDNPNWDPRELEEKFDAELRGDRQYSNQVSEAALMDDPVAGEGIDISQLGAGRLELASLREMGLTEDEINVLKARKMTAKVGLHPDLVADLPGIQMGSGDTLVKALLDADPPSVVIEGLTDARMLQEHGELATPEAIEREADKAIHNEARARMVATEANALAKATGQRRILAAAAKQFAQAMVARVKVRNLRPSQYANAAARAGKAAEKASRSGDINQAAAEKRTQLVNTYATQAAYDARTEVDSTIRYLRKFDREGTRKGLDVEYLDQIDSLLARFDLRGGQTLRAIDKRTSLANWLAAQEQEGFEPDVPDYLANEANRTHFKNLTIEQLRGLADTVRQIEHLGRLKKQLLTAKDKRELDAIVSQIKESIETNAGGRVVNNERRNTLQSQAGYVWRGAMAAHRKAASVVREMDGFEDGGPLWEYFTRSMNAAGDREAAMRSDAATRLHELAKPVMTGEPMGGRGRYFPTVDRHLNRGERIAIALNWGNESNRQRLTGGHGWTAAQLQPVLQSLTTQEWQFVQGVWDFFESYRPQIAAKERRVYGKEPDWIDPSPFTLQTADGQTVTIDGGYYPIKYDPAQSGKAGEFAEAEEAKAMMRAAYTASTTRRSFTKSRAEEVTGRPLVLTFDGIWQGANEVIHDLAWHEWLIDANRLLKRLDDPIRTHYGAEYVDVLRKAVKDSARGDIPAANMVEKALHHARVGVTVVGMGWNLTTAMLQPLGLTNSIVRVGAKWIARGASQFYGSPLQMAEKAREVRAMSSMMDNRAMTMNREINDVRNRLEARSDWRQKMEATYFVLIQKLQASVDYPTWLGAYEKAMADPANLYPDGTINEARAISLADQAVLDSQGGGQIKDLAQIQRGGPLPKLFTNFYSYFNVLMNLTTEQTRKRVRKGQYLALAGDYMLLMVVPAVLSAMLRDALKGEDDEDEYIKGIASEFVGYPFGMFVGLREIAGGAQAMVGVGGPFNYSGPAGVRLFGEIDKLGKQLGQGELDAALFKSANNVAGILFHYPAGQVNRLVEGVVALVEGRTRNPLAPLAGVPYDR